MDPSEPKRIGDYELLELIGKGAQGHVYKGRCTAAGHEFVKEGAVVAVKILIRGSDDPKDDARFKRQARILEKLDHPGICRYIDYFIDQEGEWDEKKCLVTEFLDGASLADRIRRYPRGLPWDEVEKVFEQSLGALCHAAGQHVVHRDLKPSNIYLTKSGEAKLIDFGIAREEGGEETSTTGWRGSFDYMAPDFVRTENFRGDEQSDVFSMGICFFIALTGTLPFPAFGENAHIGYLQRWQAGEETRPNFKHGAFRVLTHLKPFVLKSLNPDREERFRNFDEMLDEFRKVRPRTVRHKGKDNYELVEMLGRGGFGEVFKGKRESDGQFVAVKHLFAGRQTSRFIKEAHLLQTYKHPDIVEYVDFIEIEGMGDDKEFFLIMQYLPGMPGAGLNARIRRSRTGLDPAEVTELFIHYLSALQYLHENPKPIIHRDIKPGNLYAPPGQPHLAKIFDLGVARDVTGTLTTGMIPGTLDYMAPEFASVEGDRGSPQSDLYAMGISMFEALTGHKPFPRLPKADQEAFVAFVARAQNPPEVEYSNQAFKAFPGLVAIVRNTLAFDPKKRYAKASEMLADLERFLRDAIDLAGSEDLTDDAETRATIADPELIARLQAHREGQPSAIPASAIADLDASPALSPAMERPDWLEEDEGLSPPSPAGTPTPSPALTPSREGPPTSAGRRTKPWFAMVGSLIIVLLIGALVFMVLRGRGPEQSAAASTDKDRITVFLDERSTPAPEESYVRDLSLMLAQARASKHQDPGNEGWWDKQIADLTDLGETVPAAFDAAFGAAVAEGDVKEAGHVQQVWEQLDDAMPIMGITRSDFISRSDTMDKKVGQLEYQLAVQGIEETIPERIADAAGLARAEQAFQNLQVTKDRPWPYVLPADAEKEFTKLRTGLTQTLTNYVEQLRTEALGRYDRLEDAEDIWQALGTVGSDAPGLLSLTGSAYDRAVTEVDQARTRSLRLTEYADAVRSVRGLIPDQVSDAAALAQAEEAALAYEDFMARTWDGVAEDERTTVGDDLRSNLTGRVSDYVQNLRGDALGQMKTFEDPVTEWDALNAIGTDAPTVIGLLGPVYGDTVREVSQARTRMKNLAGYGEAVKNLRALVPEKLDSPGQLADANRAVDALDAFTAQTWEGVASDEVAAVAGEVRAPLEAYIDRYVTDLRTRALERFGRMEDTTAELDELRALREKAPSLVRLVDRAYEGAVTEVELARSKLIGKSEFTTALARAYEVLPATLRDAEDLVRAEQAAQALQQVQAQAWEGVTETEKDEALGRLKEDVVRRSEVYLTTLKDRAVATYGRLEDADPDRAQLMAVSTTAPTIVSLVGEAYPAALAEVDTAREQQQRMVAFSQALDGIRAALPDRIASVEDLVRAEAAAGEYNDVAGRRWKGVTDERKKKLLDPIQQRLLLDTSAYVEALQNDAMTRYERMEDADAVLKALRAMEKSAPKLVALLGPAHAEAVAAVEGARTKKENIATFEQNMNRIQTALPQTDIDATSVSRTEQAVEAYRAVLDHTWEDISPTRKREALDPIRDVLVRRAATYVKGLETAAIAQYNALENADPMRDELASLKTDAPNLIGLVDTTYASAVTAVDAARDTKLRREEELRVEQAQQEAARLEKERQAKLRTAEEVELKKVENAWAAIQQSWQAKDGANLSPEYALVLHGAFEVDDFRARYEDIHTAFREQIRTVFGAELETADNAITGFRTFLYQVADPSISGSYRAYRENPPPVDFGLPPMENLEEMGLGLTQVRARRLKAWSENGPQLESVAGRKTLSERLMKLGAESREAGIQEEAYLCEMESILMTSEPAVFPGTLEDRAEPAELLRWRAHASYQPEVSALDVLRDLSRYASRADELNEYDLRLALFASYYSWRNFIQGEGRYAQRVRDQLKEIVAKADAEVTTQALDFLIDYIEGGVDGDTEYPGLYMVSALSFMSDDTALGKQAAAWLGENADDPVYAARLEIIELQLRLLRKLLGA